VRAVTDQPAGDVTVLLVDDQELIRRGLRMVLEEEPGLRVVGEAADGEQAVRICATLRPDVVVMDVRMPGLDGVEATRRIVAAHPGTQVLVLTTFDLDEYAFAALRHGASGFLLKDVPPSELARAIRRVAEGDAVMAPSTTRRLLDRVVGHLDAPVAPPDDGPLAPLTERERQILLEMAGGLSNAEIAAKLFLAENTVKTHVGRILTKLGLRDRVQAVVLAYRCGLVPPEP
jgi:DNA-binding NarL/FixJ family response regulator